MNEGTFLKQAVVVRVENAFFFSLCAVNIVHKEKMAEKEDATAARAFVR